MAHYFERIALYAEQSLEGHPITFCHYPMLEWKNSRKEGSSRLGYLVHGHIHNNIYPQYRAIFDLPNALNACVEVNGYTPVTFEELIANNDAFKQKALAQLDHNN